MTDQIIYASELRTGDVARLGLVPETVDRVVKSSDGERLYVYTRAEAVIVVRPHYRVTVESREIV